MKINKEDREAEKKAEKERWKKERSETLEKLR